MLKRIWWADIKGSKIKWLHTTQRICSHLNKWPDERWKVFTTDVVKQQTSRIKVLKHTRVIQNKFVVSLFLFLFCSLLFFGFFYIYLPHVGWMEISFGYAWNRAQWRRRVEWCVSAGVLGHLGKRTNCNMVQKKMNDEMLFFILYYVSDIERSTKKRTSTYICIRKMDSFNTQCENIPFVLLWSTQHFSLFYLSLVFSKRMLSFLTAGSWKRKIFRV